MWPDDRKRGYILTGKILQYSHYHRRVIIAPLFRYKGTEAPEMGKEIIVEVLMEFF